MTPEWFRSLKNSKANRAAIIPIGVRLEDPECSEKAAASNRDASNVVPGLLACWHVAGLEASNGLGAYAVAARKTVRRQPGPAVSSYIPPRSRWK
jgi:hypothetical protein